MAEPTRPANPNHTPYDATIAGAVRLLACDASTLASAVPMLLIASATLPLILLLFLINSPRWIGTVVLVPTTEKQLFGVRRTDRYVTRLCRSTQPNVLNESSVMLGLFKVSDKKRGIAACETERL